MNPYLQCLYLLNKQRGGGGKLKREQQANKLQEIKNTNEEFVKKYNNLDNKITEITNIIENIKTNNMEFIESAINISKEEKLIDNAEKISTYYDGILQNFEHISNINTSITEETDEYLSQTFTNMMSQFKKQISVPVVNNSRITDYGTGGINSLFGMWYIAKHSPKECAIIDTIVVTDEDIYKTTDPIYGDHIDISDGQYFKESVCKNKRYLFGNVGFFSDYTAHDVALIIDTVDNSYLIIDPHGRGEKYIGFQNQRLTLQYTLEKGFSGITEADEKACPRLGLQTNKYRSFSSATDGGLCWLYTLFTLDTIIRQGKSLDSLLDYDPEVARVKFLEFVDRFEEFRKYQIYRSGLFTEQEKKNFETETYTAEMISVIRRQIIKQK